MKMYSSTRGFELYKDIKVVQPLPDLKFPNHMTCLSSKYNLTIIGRTPNHITTLSCLSPSLLSCLTFFTFTFTVQHFHSHSLYSIFFQQPPQLLQVGVHQSDTLYGAPSYEPIPDIKFEKDYSYTGGRDKNRLFHGKGVVEFSDGGYMEVCLFVEHADANFLQNFRKGFSYPWQSICRKPFPQRSRHIAILYQKAEVNAPSPNSTINYVTTLSKTLRSRYRRYPDVVAFSAS